MSIWSWFTGLFRREKPVTEKELREQLSVLDIQQASWTDKARRAEQLKNAAYLKGTRSADAREKLDCARQVDKLDLDTRQYDANAAVLQQRKNIVDTWLRRLQAQRVAPSRTEMAAATAEVERLATDNALAQAALDAAAISIGVAEAGRLEGVPQESENVQRILASMNAPKPGTEAGARQVEPRSEQQ